MKKDRYEILKKNITGVILYQLGQYWYDSDFSLIPWSTTTTPNVGVIVNDVSWYNNVTYSNNETIFYDGEIYKSTTDSNLNNNPSTQTTKWIKINKYDRITTKQEKYYQWSGTSWVAISKNSAYNTLQIPLFLEDSVDEMGVMVGIGDENGELYMEQIEQLVNFHYSQTGSFVKVFSTTNPEKLRSIIDQEYTVSWGHNNVTSSLEVNKGIIGTNFPTASYTYPTTPNTYTISLSLNSPWNREKIIKNVTVPQFTGNTQNILGSITFLTLPYVNQILTDEERTLDYLNNLDYTDNYGPATRLGEIPSSSFQYMAFGKSKMADFKIYGGGINSSSFTYSGDTTGYTFTYTGSFISGTSYNMITQQYVDYPDGTTLITGSTTGYTREEVFNQALTRNEHFLGFIDEPSIYSDIFVERGKQGVLEKTHRLGEIDSLGELDIYGNGYFKVRKQ
jgi:hypothetical protein